MHIDSMIWVVVGGRLPQRLSIIAESVRVVWVKTQLPLYYTLLQRLLPQVSAWCEETAPWYHALHLLYLATRTCLTRGTLRQGRTWPPPAITMYHWRLFLCIHFLCIFFYHGHTSEIQDLILSKYPP
jgi:hypothetical protein